MSSRRGGLARRFGRGAGLLVALAAFAAAGGTARAGAATPATPKPTMPKAATPKAVTPKAATPQASPPSATALAAAVKAKRLAVRQALLDQARKSLALVRMTLQRDLRPEAPPIGSWVEAYITEKQPFEIPGVWIDSSGLLLISEIELNDERIKEIQIVDAEGRAWPAERAGVLREAPGLFFRVVRREGEAALPEFPALRFVPQGALHLGEDLITVTLTRLSTWDLKLGGAACTEQTFRSYELPAADGYQVPPRVPTIEASSGPLASWGGNPDLTLLFNENGGAVGVALGSAQPAADPEPYLPWRGLRLLQGPRLTHAEVLALPQQIEKAATGWVVEVKLFFRQEDEEESGGRFGRRGYWSGGGGGGGGSGGWSTGELELAYYGIAVSEKLVFLPGEVDKDLLKRLERVEVGTDGALGQPPPLPPPPTTESEEAAEEALRNKGRFGKGFLAHWRGAYRALGGFLVEADQLPPKGLPVPADLFADPQLKRGELMYLIHPQRKFDRKYLFVQQTRWVDEMIGYRNAPAIRFFPSVGSGSFLVDADGRLRGFGARLRREDEEEERFRSEQGRYYGYGGGSSQLYVCATLKELLTAPAETAFDPKLKPLPKEEQKRLPWLGVEFTGVGQPLAKKFGVLKETKDGAIGMLLIVVYRGSPAERLGLKEGDILLSLTPKGKPKIELSGGRQDFYGSGFGGYYGGGMFGYGFYQPWLARRNTLTSLLETLGVGKSVSLEVCRRSAPEGQRVAPLAYEIEKAPPDFESSKKRRDKILGLTVKNLTYEVRYACKLEAEAEGVVVAKVDEGKSAAVARIAPLDLIRAIDDEPVRSVDALMQTVAAARQAGRKTVKVRLWRLGEPERYADLFLEELKSREHEEAGGPGGEPGAPDGEPEPEPEPGPE